MSDIYFNECCDMGTYKHQIPMPIKGRRQDIDFCISDIVAALNAANITTVFSCCGHGDEAKSRIDLEDGRILLIRNLKKEVYNKKIMKHRYYCVLCGSELEEIGLGVLQCLKCRENFIPYIDINGLQCISWSKEIEPEKIKGE